MSIDIDWANLTAGPEGVALAEQIRVFVDDKFQQVRLPGFIRSVHVHAFDFGQECPTVELKDITDPLPDFYEDDDEISDADEVDDTKPDTKPLEPPPTFGSANGSVHDPPVTFKRPTYIDTRVPAKGFHQNASDHLTRMALPRAGTPGIPGGTSNLSYFHLPLSAGYSGSATPFAAVAGGSPFAAWPDHHFPAPMSISRPHSPHHPFPVYADPSSRPSTSDSYGAASPYMPQTDNLKTSEDRQDAASPSAPSPLDTQITMHITYSGNVSLSITASLLLDYPMSSFASIPLKLSITGLSFDGVALMAYLQKKAHFCFLGPEDAQILVGADSKRPEERDLDGSSMGSSGKTKLGGLIKEIRVESEIGKREGGKQSLKNVGKVEKFVIEQVRRIFEDEFVWPSWWTFLV